MTTDNGQQTTDFLHSIPRTRTRTRPHFPFPFPAPIPVPILNFFHLSLFL